MTSGGGCDPPPPRPPTGDKGKGVVSDADPRPTRRRNRPSHHIVIREFVDGYSPMPSTSTLSLPALALRPPTPTLRPSAPTPRPPTPTPRPPTPTSRRPVATPPPPLRVLTPPPPQRAATPRPLIALEIDMIPIPRFMTHAHQGTSTSAGVAKMSRAHRQAEEEQYSPDYSLSPSEAGVGDDESEEVEEIEFMPDGRLIIRFLPSKRAAFAISYVIHRRYHRACPS